MRGKGQVWHSFCSKILEKDMLEFLPFFPLSLFNQKKCSEPELLRTAKASGMASWVDMETQVQPRPGGRFPPPDPTHGGSRVVGKLLPLASCLLPTRYEWGSGQIDLQGNDLSGLCRPRASSYSSKILLSNLIIKSTTATAATLFLYQ